MCMSTPKVQGANNTPVEYLHNSYLDSGMIGQGFTTGRNQLRIDLNARQGGVIGSNPGNPGLRPGVTTPGTTTPAFNQPGIIPGAPALQQPGFTVPSPGTVTPTVGGALAGTMPGILARPMPIGIRGVATR